MAMRDEWIDAIFSKLTLVYGVRFKGMYGGMSADQIRADWAHELDGVSGDGVHHALKNLPPDFPPNVLQFKALCVSERPEPMRKLIRGSGVRIAPRLKEQLMQLQERMRNDPVDPLAGARSLRQKERNGILLTRAQKEFWRTALAREMRHEESVDD